MQIVAMVITNITAADIPIEVSIFLDTPRNGHIPRNCANTILLTNIAEIMIKNGYTEVTIATPVEGTEKDEKVLVSATEYGQLDDDALITAFKADGKNIMIPKMNLKVEI